MSNILMFALQTLFELNPFHILGIDWIFDPIDALFSWFLVSR